MDLCIMSSVLGLDVPDDPGFETFLTHIYKKNMFTDVVIELQGPAEPVSFSAHKLVLSIWSPKFAEMFYNAENLNNLVCLKNIDPIAFEDMLNFMYGLEPVLESHKRACELNKVATEFEVTCLSNLCQYYLIDVVVEIANVFDILETAECMQNKSLVDRCKNLIQNETKSIVCCYECSDITPSMIKIILSSPKLSLHSEYDLIIWVLACAKNWYLEHSMYSNTREVLDEFLPQLHFPILTNTQFAQLYKNNDDVFSKDEALKIFMSIGMRDTSLMPVWYNTNATFRVYTG